MFKSKSKSQTMREQATEVAGDLMEKLAPHVESARDKAAPMIADAREKTAPVLAEARDRATPAYDSAKTKFNAEVLPVVAAAIASAAEATEEARSEAKKRGRATAAALKGEVAVPEKSSHKFRNFLVVTGLAGLVAVIAKKFSDREASSAWQSSYTPTPAAPAAGPSYTPTPSAPQAGLDETPFATAAAAASGSDEGGAGPDEAAADATDEPHTVSTPDDPAEEIDVEGEFKN